MNVLWEETHYNLMKPVKMLHKTNESTFFKRISEMSERTTFTNLLKKFTKVTSPYRELDLVTLNLSVALMP